jgi:hypothetical protein
MEAVEAEDLSVKEFTVEDDESSIEKPGAKPRGGRNSRRGTNQ